MNAASSSQTSQSPNVCNVHTSRRSALLRVDPYIYIYIYIYLSKAIVYLSSRNGMQLSLIYQRALPSRSKRESGARQHTIYAPMRAHTPRTPHENTYTHTKTCTYTHTHTYLRTNAHLHLYIGRQSKHTLACRCLCSIAAMAPGRAVSLLQ